ncbi:MAG TPA: hypothetical protein VMT35_09015 [Ignavibacteriaceae bacterium]|nr:hypothetical protein [Ignavibacteriaceae bacterium]
MRNTLIPLLIIAASSIVYSQIELRGGMGIDFASTPSLKDYINQIVGTELLGSFNSAIVFSGEADYYLNENFSSGIDAGYLINSYTSIDDLGKYEFSYNILSLSVMGYYVITGEGYHFKFGGGIGPRFVSADESLPGTASTMTYRSTGFGIIIRADGNTLLSGRVYANIGADIKYDFNGEPSNNGNHLVNLIIPENVSLNSLSFGVRLGVSYLF